MNKNRIAEVYWFDITEKQNGNSSVVSPDPLIHVISVGYFVGKFKDKFGTEYAKLCYKRCTDSGNNDDFIVIPTGCIEKIKYR